MPSPKLQQLAHEHVSEYFYSADIMKRHNGLDRLLYLVCTGGTASNILDEKLGLSQAALAVIRNTLPSDQAKEIVLHTLAPPTTTSTTTPEQEPQELPPPTVVQ
jgi:hypothetical protein